MPCESLTAEQASDALAALGVRVAPGEVRLEARDGRWMARLPGERLAWFAATEAARAGLAAQRRLLRMLETRCRFAVPRVLAEAPDGALDVRTMVPGRTDAHWLFDLVCADADAAARVGGAIGTVLADLHTAFAVGDVAGWLLGSSGWPERREAVREHLPRVVDDPALHARADEVMARYEALRVPEEDGALVHGDLGFHNLTVDERTLEVRGVFDWEEAYWADRHLDFRYLVADLERWHLLDAALAAYEPAAGRALSRERIVLYNAAWAVSFLAYRVGVPPEERWAGRTLVEDLAWTRRAVDLVLSSPA